MITDNENEIVLDLTAELVEDLGSKPLVLAVRDVQPVEQSVKAQGNSDMDTLTNQFDAMKMLGRIEALQFIETVSQKTMIECYQAIKQRKLYKGLPFNRDGVNETISTLEQFCQVFFGKTSRRLEQLVGNYRIIGAELYEQAEKIGFRQQDYNALKKVPEADRQTVAAAIRAADLDTALELIDQLAIKHVHEQEALLAEQELLRRELQVDIRELEKKRGKEAEFTARLEKELAYSNNQLAVRMNREATHNPFALDEHTLAMREESAAYGWGVHIHVEHLQLLMHRHFSTPANSAEDMQVRVNSFAGAVSAIVAEVVGLEKVFVELFAQHLPDYQPGLVDKFTDDEMTRLTTTRAMLSNQLNERQTRREYERQLLFVKKRGRPFQEDK